MSGGLGLRSSCKVGTDASAPLGYPELGVLSLLALADPGGLRCGARSPGLWKMFPRVSRARERQGPRGWCSQCPWVVLAGIRCRRRSRGWGLRCKDSRHVRPSRRVCRLEGGVPPTPPPPPRGEVASTACQQGLSLGVLLGNVSRAGSTFFWRPSNIRPLG